MSHVPYIGVKVESVLPHFEEWNKAGGVSRREPSEAPESTLSTYVFVFFGGEGLYVYIYEDQFLLECMYR
jgi:hypothetical protein